MPHLRELYGWRANNIPTCGPPDAYHQRIGLLFRELCIKHGIADRMPRYCGSGALTVDKRIAELLHLKLYELEFARAPAPRLWAYRKAAWQMDEMRESVAGIYGNQGEAGLRSLPNIGPYISRDISA